MENLSQILLSFVITSLFIWMAIPLAEKIGLVDKPGGHKTHHDHIPVVGGIGIFLGLLGALAILDVNIIDNLPLIFSGLLLLFTGVLDDKYFLSAYTRFAAQIGAAAILVVADKTVLSNLGFLLFEGETFHLASWAIPLTIFATVGVINAVNMTDGLDGLAGGLSLVTLASATILLAISGTPNIFFVVPVFSMSAILAFLMFNYRTPWLKKAKVFMGNGGSMLLGIIIAWLLIKFSQGYYKAFSPVTALWIFAIPLMDTICIMSRRVMHGNSPFAADKEHLHHIFLRMGFSVQHSVALVISIASLCALFGMTASLYGIQENIMFFIFIAVFILYFITMERSWKKINNNEGMIITGVLEKPFAPAFKANSTK